MLLKFILRLILVIGVANTLSPVIIIPGTGGNQLEAKLTNKIKPHWYCHSSTPDYFTLWLDIKLLLPYAQNCWADNMKLVWNMNTMAVGNTPGVTTRVPGFGQTYSVEVIDSLGIVKYMKPLVDELTTLGYVKGHNLKAAPYDFRYSPESLPDNYHNNLKAMIEDSYSESNESVTLISHSYGCPITLYFLSMQSKIWKEKYIKQWIALSGVYGGTIQEVLLFASGYLESIPSTIVDRLTMRGEQRTSTSNLFMLPNSALWLTDDVVVTTEKRTYKLSEIDDLLTEVGFPEGAKMRRYITNTSQLMDVPPGVPIYCYYGNIPESTIKHLIFTDDFPESVHKVEKGLGDGTVNHESLSLCKKFRSIQNEVVKVKEVNGADHNGVISDDNVLRDIKALLLN